MIPCLNDHRSRNTQDKIGSTSSYNKSHWFCSKLKSYFPKISQIHIKKHYRIQNSTLVSFKTLLLVSEFTINAPNSKCHTLSNTAANLSSALYHHFPVSFSCFESNFEYLLWAKSLYSVYFQVSSSCFKFSFDFWFHFPVSNPLSILVSVLASKTHFASVFNFSLTFSAPICQFASHCQFYLPVSTSGFEFRH